MAFVNVGDATGEKESVAHKVISQPFVAAQTTCSVVGPISCSIGGLAGVSMVFTADFRK
jgi:hypothetical protein